MASSMYNVQFALKICENHSGKELHAFCQTCERRICTSCIKGDHISHDWELMIDLLKKKRRHLPAECREVRTNQLPLLKKEIDRFDRKIKNMEVNFKHNETAWNKSRQNYIDEINKIFDGGIDKCLQIMEGEKQEILNERDKLKEKVEFLEKITESLDSEIDTLPDNDILDMEREMREELETAATFSADKYTCSIIFDPGKINLNSLREMIGDIQCVSVKEVHDLDKYPSAIHRISVTSLDKATIKVHKESYAKSVNTNGEELNIIKIPCYDFVITRSGNTVLVDKANHAITVLNKSGDTISSVRTKPLYPSFISKTEDDDILVTLWDGRDTYHLVPTSRRIVQRMSITCKVLHTYEFREDGKTRMFTYPSRTSENKNSDVCVINYLSENTKELIVLKSDGHVRFTYKGDGIRSEMFRPVDVECDSQCRILISEFNTKSIHVLSSDGKYLCELCHYESIHPWSISICGGYLWCGFFEGRIKVFEY